MDLDMLKTGEILVTEMKKVCEVYFDKLIKVLKSSLKSQDLISAINVLTVLVVCYSAAIIDWT